MIREDLFQALPGEIASRIHAGLPGLRTCEALWGPFNIEELKARGIAAPAVLISCLSLKQIGVRSGPEYDYGLRMMAYVVTRNTLGPSRDTAAAAIVGALIRMIPDRYWGQRGVGEAQDVRAQVLVNQTTRDAAASLFVVEWIQPVSLAEIEPGAIVPLELYVGQSPDVGPDFEADYEQIGGAG